MRVRQAACRYGACVLCPLHYVLTLDVCVVQMGVCACVCTVKAGVGIIASFGCVGCVYACECACV
jgi:hypothetical protein